MYGAVCKWVPRRWLQNGSHSPNSALRSNPATLGPKGSLFLTRPTLFDYLASREDLEWRSSDVFNWISEGKLDLRLEYFYPLAEARAAHEALEARMTTGKVILKP